MTTRLVFLLLGILFCNAAAVDAQTRPSPSSKRPNVLFLIIDDLRPNLGCYGDSAAISPNIDRLATEGVMFTRAYCQYPICNPSRVSVMTGRRPDSTGVMGNHQVIHEALPRAITINKHFKSHGYQAIGMGKVYHSSQGTQGGWSKPYVKSKWLDYVRPENRAIADVFFTPQKPKGQQPPASTEAEDVTDDEYCDGAIAAAAVTELRRCAETGEPFFLAVGFRHPHLPWCAPKKYWKLYDRKNVPVATNDFFPKDAPPVATTRWGELFGYADIPDRENLSDALVRQSVHGYYACVSYVDAQVGRVLQALKRNGLADNTIVVLWGDHGYQLGHNGVWAKGVNWESTVHAPLLLRIPGFTKPGQRISTLTEFIDIYPTLCQASGLPIPEPCEGRSLLPLLRGTSIAQGKVRFQPIPSR